MHAEPTTLSTSNVPAWDLSRLVHATWPAALTVATLDGIFAVVTYVFVLDRYSVVGALQYIASGLLGPAAFDGGLWSAALGAGIHLFFSFFFSALYVGAVMTNPAVRRASGPLLGMAYGATIWVVMSQAVFPFTGLPVSNDGPWLFLAFVADHAFFVGLPIAWIGAARLRASA